MPGKGPRRHQVDYTMHWQVPTAAGTQPSGDLQSRGTLHNVSFRHRMLQEEVLQHGYPPHLAAGLEAEYGREEGTQLVVLPRTHVDSD